MNNSRNLSPRVVAELKWLATVYVREFKRYQVARAKRAQCVPYGADYNATNSDVYMGRGILMGLRAGMQAMVRATGE